MVPCTGGRFRRAMRSFTLGSGSLKRRTDRVQMVARVVLVLAVALAPVLAAVAVGTTTTRLEARAAQQAAERQLVAAVLLTDAERLTDSAADHGAAVVVVPVRARWTSGGLPREGTVFAAPGTRAGSTVQAWRGSDGGHVAPPLDRRDIVRMATISGALVLLGVPLGVGALYAALVVALDAHRARRWGQEWAAVEPRWGTRLM
jgi:hypothetical protein